MNLKLISSSTIALLLGAGFLLLTGSYTDNNGFWFAGAILLVVGLIPALNEARSRDDAAKQDRADRA